MAFTYEISPSGDHVHVIGTGDVTTDNCIGIIERVLSDPRCRPDSTALIDLSDAVYKHGNDAEAVRIAKALEAFEPMLQNNIAVVAKKGTLFPAEIFCLHVRQAKQIRIRVFTELAAAEAYCHEAPTPPPGHRRRLVRVA